MGYRLHHSAPRRTSVPLNAYIDSSVLLRLILSEPQPLEIWSKITTAVSSELIRVECLRTIDRARIRVGLSDQQVSAARAAVLETISGITLVGISPAVLERATQPFPTTLGTLDAMHLSSALLARNGFDGLVLATHDQELSVAARSMGFEVFGAPGTSD
ncbi:MAG: type II toxin-antitoxin system VapC family toxin [Actinomycetota bacterium]